MYDRLDLLSKLYQRSVFGAAKRVSAGDRLSGPLVVDLDPTTFCDLACPECISASLLNQSRFSRERLIDLVGEFADAGVKAVVLIGGGEPLAHPATKDVISLLHENGLRVGLVTNGTLIGGCIEVLASCVDWVRISVDAGTASTYQEVRPDKRGANRFDRVVENIGSLARVATGSVGYSFLIISRYDANGNIVFSNHAELLQAAKLAKRLGCDYFEAKAMFNDDHYVVGLSEEIMLSVTSQMLEIQSLEDENFSVEISSTLVSLTLNRGAYQEKSYTACAVSELRTVVTPSGVYACAYHRGNSAARVGDVLNKDFVSMWRDREAKTVDPSVQCGFHCARHGQNIAIGELNADGRPFIPTKDYDVFF